MGEQSRRAGEPGRRPAPVERDGTPRRELAHWLRRALAEHGEPTLETMLRGLPDDARLSRSALAKALRGETFPELPLVRSVLRTAGADDAEIEAWAEYWHHLDRLEKRRRQGEAVVATPPRWIEGDPAPEPAPVVEEPPADPAPEPVRPSRRRVGRGWLVAVGSAVVGAGLTLLVVALVEGRLGPSEPSAATVLDPVTSSVPKTFRLVGNYNGLPEGTLLWATTFDPGTGRYFPQDKPCVTRDDESFDCGQYYLGRQFAPDTDPYRVDLFVADSGASNSLLQYQIDKGGPDGPNPGLTALPPGTTVIGTRTYRRS
ncbi:hypothetical protein [Actinomycetospora termitidis]|uniref:XRE family transcriptional regulator n=1 Tax=Actinomycetospora termitidis TaxID=3053470 RepID=A0ABT7MH57_9PSEU|nr:hypothetical protein [Actinomycetospora sp. Odt1-22]MDL5160009.1 hypothetical protein [Actinomycetospora sp. Odt1-22]